MGMLASGVNLELAHHIATKWSSRNHAFDGKTNSLFRRFGNHFIEGGRFVTTWIGRVAMIDLGTGLGAGNRDLLGIDDHDVVASVHMSRVLRLVFAT